jgi:hypothetical protein
MEVPVKVVKKPNEQNAREAFITILGSLTGIEYKLSNSPDEVNRRTPDVDFVLTSSSNENDKIAVEHTIVESFERQIEYVKTWRDIACLVNAGCRERIPPDRYYFLAAPSVIVNFLARESRGQFVSYLSSWVVKTAPTLLMVDSYIQTEYEGHKITLTCSGDHEWLNGNVWGIPEEPENQKALQGERLRRAVKDKFPKLTKYKKEPGFKTALLLEDVAGTLRGNTLSGYEGLEEVDYIVVFVSNEGRMIIGNVWKEGSVWHWPVPSDRRFGFRQTPEKKAGVEI